MDKIIVLDFGGQYCHLISRRIRDFNVYSEVLPSNITKEEVSNIKNLKGIVLSGGAASVYKKDSPKLDKEILNLNIPILGVCYGHQLIAHLEKGNVKKGDFGEYGITKLNILVEDGLLKNVRLKNVWMNHKDVVKYLPDYTVSASTENSPVAVFENNKKKIYGVQFHPEVTHTEEGNKILKNFIEICKAKRERNTSNTIRNISKDIKEKIKKKAIIGLSGGVDSSTAALLINKIIGNNLVCVYVDTGLMRYKEVEFIKKEFSNLNLKIIKAEDRFLKELKGIVDPEEKRRIIGKLFIEIFDEIAEKEKVGILIQGTIYSDRIESGLTKYSSKIKSHHNVGGLPENMKLKIYEPLKDLYKDEVRDIAKKLNVSNEIINRHVFPGPGLAVRIIGEVTKEKVKIVRKASYIIEEELRKSNFYDKVWMAFAVLLPIKSVGIQGDERSYKYPVVVRIIESKDAMTANFSKIPYEILDRISTRITNELNEINRVVYDISNKPPATMEWE